MSAEPEETYWYALLPVGRRGPLTREHLLELIRHGAVTRTTLLWRHGLAQWTPAQDCFGFAFRAVVQEQRAAAQREPARGSRLPLLAMMAVCAVLGAAFYHFGTSINASPDPHRQVLRAMISGGALALALLACTALSLRRGRSGGARLLGVGYALAAVVILVVVAAVGPQLGRITESSGRMSDYRISVDDGAATIRIKGLLGPGVATLFQSQLAGHPAVRRVVIDSYGGLVDQSLDLARSIGDRRLDVEVDQHCASACLVVLLAGANRYAGPDALFGFHSPGPVEGASAWLRFGAEREGRLYSDFLRAHGLPQKYLDLIRNTPSEGIARIGAAELAEAGVLQVLTADGSPMAPEEARWRFIVAAMREGDAPGITETADLMDAIRRSGLPVAQQYSVPLAQAIESNDAKAIHANVFGLTGAVFNQALPSADPPSLTAFLDVQDRVMQRLLARQDWTACAAFLDGKGGDGKANAVPPELEPQLLASMRGVIESATRNGWQRTPVDPGQREQIAAISHHVSDEVFSHGFTHADLNLKPEARCRFATGLYHEFSQAGGDRPGEYLSTLFNIRRAS